MKSETQTNPAALEIFAAQIVNAGITISETGMEIPDLVLTAEVEDALHSTIRKIGRGHPWWIGDCGIASKKRNEGREQKMRDEAKERGDRFQPAFYRPILAEKLGVDDGTLSLYVTLANFFTPSNRFEGDHATFRHHIEAMRGGGGAKGNVKLAQRWLARSQEMKWSVSELREQVNRSFATEQKPIPPMTNPFTELDRAEEWAMQNRKCVEEFGPVEAVQFVTRFKVIGQLLDQAREIAKGLT